MKMEFFATGGVHDIPSAIYHADPCPLPSLSSSIAKLMLTASPRHVWTAHPRLNPNFEPDDDAKFDIGRAAHALMLRDGSAFEIVQAKNWATDKAKAARDGARAAGKIPLLPDQWERVTAMVAAGRAQLAAHEDASDAFTNGKPEQTLVWREGETWCRARLDWQPDESPIFDDFKSTEASAHPDAWRRTAMNLGFDIQAAFYRRGIKALGLRVKPSFRFIVQESYEPFCLSAIDLAPDAMDLADRKVDEALRRWQHCLSTGRWPGYPARTCTIDAPQWAEADFLNRETRDEMHRKDRNANEISETWLHWQAPPGWKNKPKEIA